VRTLEWRKRAFNTKILSSQDIRAVGGGGILIVLSKGTSRWAEIQTPDNVWESRTMSGRTRQSPVGGFYGYFLNLRLA
jgi:hypothetical protein